MNTKKEEELKEISEFLLNYYNSINDITITLLKCFYERYKLLEKELYYIELDKPSKFFKTKYKRYLKEKEDITNEKKELLKKIIEEYNDLIK